MTDQKQDLDNWRCLDCGTHGVMGKYCYQCGCEKGFIPEEIQSLISASNLRLLQRVEEVIEKPVTIIYTKQQVADGDWEKIPKHFDYFRTELRTKLAEIKEGL